MKLSIVAELFLTPFSTLSPPTFIFTYTWTSKEKEKALLAKQNAHMYSFTVSTFVLQKLTFSYCYFHSEIPSKLFCNHWQSFSSHTIKGICKLSCNMESNSTQLHFTNTISKGFFYRQPTLYIKTFILDNCNGINFELLDL